MLTKYSVEFIRRDKVSCDCSRRNGILGSSLEKNISLIEEKLGPNLIKVSFIFNSVTIAETA